VIHIGYPVCREIQATWKIPRQFLWIDEIYRKIIGCYKWKAIYSSMLRFRFIVLILLKEGKRANLLTFYLDQVWKPLLEIAFRIRLKGAHQYGLRIFSE